MRVQDLWGLAFEKRDPDHGGRLLGNGFCQLAQPNEYGTALGVATFTTRALARKAAKALAYKRSDFRYVVRPVKIRVTVEVIK